MMEGEMSRRQEAHVAAMRERSGRVDDQRILVAFVYRLLRDHLQAGDLEQVMMDLEANRAGYLFTNGWLAAYAQDVADRLITDRPDDETLAREMWKVTAEAEDDWDGTAFTDDDWETLNTESEQKRWRLAAHRARMRLAEPSARRPDQPA